MVHVLSRFSFVRLFGAGSQDQRLCDLFCATDALNSVQLTVCSLRFILNLYVTFGKSQSPVVLVFLVFCKTSLFIRTAHAFYFSRCL